MGQGNWSENHLWEFFFKNVCCSPLRHSGMFLGLGKVSAAIGRQKKESVMDTECTEFLSGTVEKFV